MLVAWVCPVVVPYGSLDWRFPRAREPSPFLWRLEGHLFPVIPRPPLLCVVMSPRPFLKLRLLRSVCPNNRHLPRCGCVVEVVYGLPQCRELEGDDREGVGGQAGCLNRLERGYQHSPASVHNSHQTRSTLQGSNPAPWSWFLQFLLRWPPRVGVG